MFTSLVLRHHGCLITVLCLFVFWSGSQAKASTFAISDVTAKQRNGTSLVDIEYKLNGSSSCTVCLTLRDYDYKLKWTPHARSLLNSDGDVGEGVNPGKHSFVWDASLDWNCPLGSGINDLIVTFETIPSNTKVTISWPATGHDLDICAFWQDAPTEMAGYGYPCNVDGVTWGGDIKTEGGIETLSITPSAIVQHGALEIHFNYFKQRSGDNNNNSYGSVCVRAVNSVSDISVSSSAGKNVGRRATSADPGVTLFLQEICLRKSATFRLDLSRATLTNLRVKEAKPESGYAVLAWTVEGKYPAGTTFSVFRGTGDLIDSSTEVKSGLSSSTTEWRDDKFYDRRSGESIGRPLHYWIKAQLPSGADSSRFQTVSAPLVTRNRYGLFMGLDAYRAPFAIDFNRLATGYGGFSRTFVFTGQDTELMHDGMNAFAELAEPGDMFLVAIFTHGVIDQNGKNIGLQVANDIGYYPTETFSADLKKFNQNVAVAAVINACYSGSQTAATCRPNDCPSNMAWLTSAGTDETTYGYYFHQALLTLGWEQGYAGKGGPRDGVNLLEMGEYTQNWCDSLLKGISRIHFGGSRKVLSRFSFVRKESKPAGAAPGEVTDLTAEWHKENGQEHLRFYFTPIAGAQGYSLFLQRNGGVWEPDAEWSYSGDQKRQWDYPDSIDNKFEPGHTYPFAVRAWNGHGVSDLSNPANATRPSNGPENASPSIAVSSQSIQVSQGKVLSLSPASVEGSATVDWTATGLPPGLTLDADGTLSGSAQEQGTFNVLIRAEDVATGAVGLSAFTIVVDGLWISTEDLPPATAGIPYESRFETGGGTHPLTWEALSVPPGLSVAPDGTVSGIPTEPGVHPFSVRVTDAEGAMGEKTLECVVGEPASLRIQSSDLPEGGNGWPFATDLSAVGGVPPRLWTATGLPAGLTCSQAGRIEGIPTESGIFPVTISVTDLPGSRAETNLSLVVHETVRDSGENMPGVSRFASGGAVSIVTGTGDVVHSFSEDGTFTLFRDATARILVVGGGGGGGYDCGGGGGGGGVLETNGVFLPAGTYTIVVGAGGAGGTSSSRNGGIGGVSSIEDAGGTVLFRAFGGGGGVGFSGATPVSTDSAPFASGGGGANRKSGSEPGFPEQGNAGCSSPGLMPQGGGGAGGTPAPFGDASTQRGTRSGDGGPGRTSDILGRTEAFGAGGGGGAYTANATATDRIYLRSIPGAGGDGVGGFGVPEPFAPDSPYAVHCPGRNGFGGGGGGGNNATFLGAAGGSGTVILRFSGAPDASPTPTVEFCGVVAASPFDVRLAAMLVSPGVGATTASVFLQVSENPEDIAKPEAFLVPVGENGEVEIPVVGLLPNRTYYGRFFAHNDVWAEAETPMFSFSTSAMEERTVLVSPDSPYAGLLQFHDGETGLDVSFDATSEGLVVVDGAMAATSGTSSQSTTLRPDGWNDRAGDSWSWSSGGRFGYLGWMWMERGAAYHFVENMWDSVALEIDNQTLFSATNNMGHAELATFFCGRTGWHAVRILFGGSTMDPGVRRYHEWGFGWNKNGWSTAYGACGDAFPVLENKEDEDVLLVTETPWRTVSVVATEDQGNIETFTLFLGPSEMGSTKLFCAWGDIYGAEDSNAWCHVFSVPGVETVDEEAHFLSVRLDEIDEGSLVRFFVLHEDGTTTWSETKRVGEPIEYESGVNVNETTMVMINETAIPTSWMDEHALPWVAQEDWDYRAAAESFADNGVNRVWECYVTGLDPNCATNQFFATIGFDDAGGPVVEWSPDLGTNRVYTVEGKTSLSDTNEVWHLPDENSRFFRVKVSLPE